MPFKMAMEALTLETPFFVFYCQQLALSRVHWSCLELHILEVRVAHAPCVQRNRDGLALSRGIRFLQHFSFLNFDGPLSNSVPPDVAVRHRVRHLGQVGLPWSRQHISIKVLASVGVPSFMRPQDPDQAAAADIFFVGIIHDSQEEIVFRFQRQDVVHMGIQSLGEFRRVVWRAVLHKVLDAVIIHRTIKNFNCFFRTCPKIFSSVVKKVFNWQSLCSSRLPEKTGTSLSSLYIRDVQLLLCHSKCSPSRRPHCARRL